MEGRLKGFRPNPNFISLCFMSCGPTGDDDEADVFWLVEEEVGECEDEG